MNAPSWAFTRNGPSSNANDSDNFKARPRRHCRCLANRHRFTEAIDATIAAIGLDPLRETPHRILISLHIAEGNPSEAIRHYHSYCDLLHTELGLKPSPDLTQLVLHTADRSSRVHRSVAVGKPQTWTTFLPALGSMNGQ